MTALPGWARSAVALLLLFNAAVGHAQSPMELRILATDPAPDVLLAREQPFFVRFEVRSAPALAVSAGGWFKGKPVLENGGSSAPALLPAGGIGVVSFFYWGEQPTRIDEVHLLLTDARSGAVINEYAFPVALTWLSDERPPQPSAAWVTAWQQAAASKAVSSKSTTAALASEFLWGCVLAVAILAAVAGVWWRWRRKRSAAADAGRPQ